MRSTVQSARRARLAASLAATAFLVARAAAADRPRVVLEGPEFQFGKVVTGEVVDHEFKVRNDGAGILEIRNVRMTAPLMVTRMPARILPGSEAVLHFVLDTTGLKGAFEGAIVLSLNDEELPETSLTFEGTVVPTVEVSPMPALFLAARRGEKKTAAVEIINHEQDPLRIAGVEDTSPRFTTDLKTLEEGRRYRLSVTLNAQGPGGKRVEPIVLKTSSATTPELRISASTDVRERVYTFPDAVDLGALRWDDIQRDPSLLQRAAQVLMVYQSGGSEFRATVRSEVPGLSVRTERGPKGDRYQLTLTLIRDKVMVGPIRGSLVIETNDREFPRVTVPVTGLIVEG